MSIVKEARESLIPITIVIPVTSIPSGNNPRIIMNGLVRKYV